MHSLCAIRDRSDVTSAGIFLQKSVVCADLGGLFSFTAPVATEEMEMEDEMEDADL